MSSQKPVTPKPITKEWQTEEGLFAFIYEYRTGEPKPSLSVTIKSGTAPATPATSPPPVPPFTPRTYEFENNRVSFDLQSPDHNIIKGYMTIKAFSSPKTEFGVWCDFFYGPDAYHHYIGINVTFSLAETAATSVD